MSRPLGPDSDRPAGADRPLALEEFSALMAPLGPFEPAPEIAVALSGGADSLCLTLLLAQWAARRGGRATGLIVDHGLRPESGREARWTAAQLARHGIAARILRWTGAKPAANRQAAARAARSRLLSDWCARHGVLHLALAHHRDDQAETLLLRLARGSGLDGLAAMAPVSERPWLRLLRPLLGIPKARLVASLRALDQAWVDDPTNRDPRYDRTRLRQLAPALAGEGLTAARLAATAEQLGRARAGLERALAELASGAVVIDPAGFAWADRQIVMAAERELSLRLLGRLVTTLGGADYPPRLARLERLHERLKGADFRGATLGGCRILPRGDRLLVVREAARIAALPLDPGARILWDGRFDVRLAKRSGRARGRLSVAPLGRTGWSHLRQILPEAENRRIPGPARPTLPGLWRAGDLLDVVPWRLPGRSAGAGELESCVFQPKNSLIGTWFTVA